MFPNDHPHPPRLADLPMGPPAPAPQGQAGHLPGVRAADEGAQEDQWGAVPLGVFGARL